jgi:AraC-like DNA-binding protein
MRPIDKAFVIDLKSYQIKSAMERSLPSALFLFNSRATSFLIREETSTKPIQPYFALCASRYFKRIVRTNGIAHFYGYVCDHPQNNTTTAVPDGCIDIVFDSDGSNIAARVCGTVLAHTTIPNAQGHEYFGVRFIPGITPALLSARFPDFVDNEVPLADCTRDKSLAEQIMTCRTFAEKTDMFLNLYQKSISDYSEDELKMNLFNAVKGKIISSCGNIRMKAIEDYTGYGRRYIDRVFNETTGFTPKTLCRIVRFQNTIDHLDHNNTIAISDLAADHGYFDQPQFIRDFEYFTGMSPRSYRQMIIRDNYTDKFILS